MHVYLLGLQLVDEGIPELNLTAGGDAYKERFATHHDQVHCLTVYFSGAERLKASARTAVRRTARQILGCTAITPDQVRQAIQKLKRIRNRVSRPLESPTCAGKERDARNYYHLKCANVLEKTPNSLVFRRDVVADLMDYQAGAAGDQSWVDFLRAALERIERGDHVYTHVENQLLIAHVWLTRISSSAGREDLATLGDSPDEIILLDGFSMHKRRRDPESYRAAIAGILGNLSSSGETGSLIMVVDHSDCALGRVLIELGFDNRPSSRAEPPGTSLEDTDSSSALPRALETRDASPA
jgi:hypothetical protein